MPSEGENTDGYNSDVSKSHWQFYFCSFITCFVKLVMWTLWVVIEEVLQPSLMAVNISHSLLTEGTNPLSHLGHTKIKPHKLRHMLK